MATLDSLAGDQRAVLQLVLGRGRGYDQIAGLLSIAPDSVRSRALAALDTLGPETHVPDANRRLICDYLLGQLPEADVASARELLASSPGERAWARTVSAEIAPLAAGPLPEIPDASTAEPDVEPDAEPVVEAVPDPGERPVAEPAEPASDGPRDGGETPAPAPSPPPASEPPAASSPASDDGDETAPRSSRRGGLVLIGLVVVIVIAVVLVLALHHHSRATPAAAATTTTSTQGASTTTSSSTSATTTSSTSASVTPVTQINMTATTPGSKAIAVAEVLQQGSERELAIVGQNIPANTAHNSYAVWLYNSQSSAHRLGFVSPGIAKNGKLSAAARLPSDAGKYKKLIITLETVAHPKTPGSIVLEGTITGL